MAEPVQKSPVPPAAAWSLDPTGGAKPAPYVPPIGLPPELSLPPSYFMPPLAPYATGAPPADLWSHYTDTTPAAGGNVLNEAAAGLGKKIEGMFGAGCGVNVGDRSAQCVVGDQKLQLRPYLPVPGMEP